MPEEEPKLLSPATFAKEIEEIVWMHDVDYLDAVMSYCTKHGIELETAGSMIRLSPFLRTKFKEEAARLRLLAK